MFRRYRFLAPFCLTIIVISAATDAFAQLLEDVATKIDATAAQVLEKTGVPSASLAIIEDGRIAYLSAYGKARLASNDHPEVSATPTMQYAVGSISKQFTAAAIMFLVQQGKLSLDDPIAKFLPDLTRAKDITVRMVLSHTSGYQDFWPEDYLITSMFAPTTAQHILNVWAKKPLDFEPGTKWQYSSTNYVIAGLVVEQLSGDTLLHFLQTFIFDPLGMTSVLDADTSPLPANDPTGYSRHALGPLRPAPTQGAGWAFAAGELAMSAKDLAKWNISIMNQSLLKPASYAEMFKPVMLKDGKSSAYGLGFFILNNHGAIAYEHSGEVSGFVSENIVYPERRISITVLTNEDASSAATAIARAIAAMLLTKPAAAQSPAESQALSIFTGLQDGKIDRSLFTDFCNAYFNKETISDYSSSLRPLGKPVSIKQTAEGQRGGMTLHVFQIEFAAESKPNMLKLTTYVEPDGKLEQFLVEPGS